MNNKIHTKEEIASLIMGGNFKSEKHRLFLIDKIIPDNNGCWIWTGGLNEFNYGQYAGWLAHRLVYTGLIGAIKSRTLDHLCRVTSCVNPYHMEQVSIAENCRRSTKSKLTLEKAQRIRIQSAIENIPTRILAEEYGVSMACIIDVLLGRRWVAEVENPLIYKVGCGQSRGGYQKWYKRDKKST